MDRNTNYPGQVPLETDLLKTNQFTMVGIAKLSAAMFGVGGMANGFATSQTVVPSMAVLVQPGEIYQSANLENSAYSSLAADTVHQVVKQGIALNTATLNTPAPGTAGFSINYLIEVAYQDSDIGSTVLPYYNASNPSVAYSGPANSGTAQPTIRSGIVVLSAKAGTAATTGTQTTPAPDAGYIGLYVVTVANGASTVVNANISAYAAAPVLGQPLTTGRLLARRYITSTQVYVPTPGAVNADFTGIGGGGGGGGAAANGAGTVSSGAGGGGGGWFRKRFAATAVAGITMTIGAGGSGSAGAAGGNGGSTTFSTCTAGGGGGGSLGAAASSSTNSISGAGAQGSTSGGDIGATGGQGNGAFYASTPVSGRGGASFLGDGAPYISGLSAGTVASNYGSGGSGGASVASSGAASGGGGAAGLILLEEYA